MTFNYALGDSLTGFGYYPNSISYYRNDRGDFVKRRLNQWGYFDKNYQKQKDGDVYRIGFFGDSYTQAIQVPLDETFHFLIGSRLKDHRIETLSFGVSGFSAYQSYLNSTRWSEFFDLDLIVYVFCENDLGDQIKTIKGIDVIPYPIIQGNEIVTDESFKQKIKYKSRYHYKFFNYLTSKFLVFATLSQRIKLLLEYGIKIKVTEQDREMGVNNDRDSSRPITQGDYPSLWSDSLRKHALELECRILSKWSREAIFASRLHFERILHSSSNACLRSESLHKDG